ncbi:MAG: hypothetical protein Q9176_002136 [Flavoplaca citrina]
MCNTRKATFYNTFSYIFKGDSSNTIIDPIKHGRKKRVVTQALSERSIAAMEEHILNNVRRFWRQMGSGCDVKSREGWSSPKDMTKWAGYLTFDIMGAICFSHSFEMLDKEDNRYILDVLPRGVQGEGFEMPELIGEASLLITGGTDTTATAITSTLFYLLHNPHALAILTRQLHATFPNLESIRAGPLLSESRYLKACIDEAMRISPGVPGLLPREVQAGGIVINDSYVPPGTDIGVPHYAIHHNESYFAQSWEYKPERWITDANTGVTKEDTERARSAFAPFSIGPRGCVGKALAMKEIMIVVGRLVWGYEMRLVEGSSNKQGGIGQGWGRHRPGELQMRDLFVGKAEGPVVEFRARTLDDKGETS